MGSEAAHDAERRRAERLRRALADRDDVPLPSVGVVRSPYRICPLGAHVDHQLGEVTGFAVDRAILMAFAPRTDRRVVVRSRQFYGEAEFNLDAIPESPEGDWADYARGAARVLAGLERGMTVLVDGHDNVGGLSSSAAVGVAYLLALEDVNGMPCPDAENIEFDRRIENDYIGLNNGILDQASILLSRRGCLMHLDCRTGESELVPAGQGAEFRVAVLFSGLRLPLAESDYNRRVAECRGAARRLLDLAGLPPAGPPALGLVPREVYEEHGAGLPEVLRKRAAHFFGERRRVRRGVELWRRGDLQGFGRLVNESGRSSVENYECGNEYLRTAYRALRDAPGVLGARFSGGGFRGCCIALARTGFEDRVRQVALERYLAAHPDMEGEAEVYFCAPADGAGILVRGER